MAKAIKSENVVESAVAEKKAKSTTRKKAPQIELPQTITVRQLAEYLQIEVVQVIKQLMRNGIMANINQVLGYESAASIAAALGYEAHRKAISAQQTVSAIREIKKRQLQAEEGGNLQSRPPVVTVMGHVDHGKTRLLDAIRQTKVMDSEVGGITQHIGAYQATVNDQKITFLDTPGHEAFTAMRAHGANITDVTVLVVAADDGVMPQTAEAINHARAAGVPVVVAINKIDKPEANVDRVKQQLSEAGLLIEEWGGDTVCVSISAKEKINISELLETLILVAEMEELKADPSKPAVGVVIEAKMDKTRGPLATVLIQNGTLKQGDIIAVGATWGRVRAMFNEVGKQVRKAGPSTPIEILGVSSVPQVGEIMNAVADERQAQSLVARRKEDMESETATAKGLSLNNLFDQISAGQVKELNLVLKTDVQGSIAPICDSLERLDTDKVKVRIIHSGTGNVTESDIMLAIASHGLIIGFNVNAEEGARRLASTKGIDIRYYGVIYNLIDDVEKALKGMLEPTYTEVGEGRAEVRAVFSAGKGAKVAGVYVTEGKISRNALLRVKRGEELLSESTVSSLKRFKDDVREVSSGYECGIGVKDFNDFQVGDIMESYRIEKTS